jgi:hypothetical protein
MQWRESKKDLKCSRWSCPIESNIIQEYILVVGLVIVDEEVGLLILTSDYSIFYGEL